MEKHKRIGILGGTFNPIHLGHLLLAEQAKEKLGLEKVVFVPVNLPALKKVRDLASAKMRWQMVKLAIKHNPGFTVSDVEIKRRGISYSIETLKYFKKKFEKAELYFILGSDFLKEFSQWKQPQQVKKICRLAIAQRPGFSLKNLPAKTVHFKIPVLNISSTDIRRRIKMRKSIRYLVPEAVRKYIWQKNLYRNSASPFKT